MIRMAKYINADLLEVVGFTDQEGSFSDGVQWLLEYIDALPSADVQSVVRCKDCKHYRVQGGMYGFCNKLDLQADVDDFCSEGEKMDGGQGD